MNEGHFSIVFLPHIYFLPPLLLLFLVAYTWPKRKTPLIQAFLVFLVSCFIYTAAHAFQGLSSTFETVRFWHRIEYIGIATLPSVWLLMVFRYTARDHWLASRIIRTVLVGMPLLSYLINITNETHGFFYRSLTITEYEGLRTLTPVPGPWYYVHMGYINAATIAGIFLLIDSLFQHGRLGWEYRKRTIFMLVGASAPWFTLLWYILGSAPWGIAATPFGIAAAGFLYAAGIFKLGMIDLVPIAREQAFDAIGEAIVVFDMRYRLIDYNPAATVFLPRLARTPLGTPVTEVFDHFPHVIEQITDGLPGIEIEITDEQSHTTRYLFVRLSKITNRLGTLIGGILMLSDMTDRELLMQRLEEMALYDPLTGLLNRRAFADRFHTEVDRATRHKRPLGFLMIDLDHFKQVNDTYGHPAGDLVLRTVSATCREMVRMHDIVARYGGEEIAIVLPEALPEDVITIAERLRTRIAELTIPYGDNLVRITASFGASHLDRIEQRHGDTLVAAADAALYRAKAEGRNRVCSAWSRTDTSGKGIHDFRG